MRKKIVITALTAMVLASTVFSPITSYAARPAGAPDVSAEDINKAKNNYSVNIEKYYYAWCDQYIDELNALPTARDKYRRIVELVATNWEGITETIYGYSADIDMYMSGKTSANATSAMVKYLCDKVGIPAIESGHFIGYVYNPSTYVQIDGITYTSSIAGLRVYGMDDMYIFIDKNFGNLELTEDPFNPIEQPAPITGPMSNFTECINLAKNKTVVLYRTDNTLTDFISSPEMNKLYESEYKFYKIANNTATVMTEEEAISLGYVVQ